MQDFRPFSGRVFGGGGWPAAQHQQQPAKCPRCESTNTKFCYYNNYNLAQPRHFCKACRRYWTKGGVLRNVPVGGGCRKSKRPSSSSSSKATSQPSANADAPSDSPRHRRPRLLSFSSDSITDISAAVATPSSVPICDPTPPDPPSEPLAPPFCPAPEIFPDPPPTGLGFSDPPRAKAKAAPSVDQAVPADPTPRGGGTVAWAGGGLDPQLFDLASAVDPSAYWNQSHWMDADHPLYLP
ncbi:dof zinc finger protein 4-like [Zingiber officinale]|uniref:Dof zinc finger protein n=1 Tax=Zingiber officinale TaxID=94328 RepID=A0A8J5GQY4_ZINOF|nr:dof zinc finger protein 4-like [Zingiber officinale]XP_042375378.1 dof zinc finger protein 4-like [Zingiber officinale]XP_042375379.1 dof zinc finger protein 4-like [Zingiber officinale]KAG6513322.1 hypothetical protein ZIOFF_023646 [Zingiber officinale]